MLLKVKNLYIYLCYTRKQTINDISICPRLKATVAFRLDLICFVQNVVLIARLTTNKCKARNFKSFGGFQNSSTPPWRHLADNK